ncbi:MAG: caspase family protein [Hyphomicrobium sp.]
MTATSDGQEVGRRVALVIGNADYRLGPSLANPKADAAAIAEALRRLDFDPVEQYLDLDKPGHDKALRQFALQSRKADMAVVYYAGHGMELDGENYLLPVDAELGDVSSLAFETTRLSDLMRAVDGAGRFRFVILDACRDNPFRRQMQGIEATRSMLSRGLAAPPDYSGNTLVAYAARHGTQAKDGKKGANSPFAAAFLKHIETPNIDIRIVIGRIRDDVLTATDNIQEPAIYGSMGGAEIQLKHVAAILTQPPAAEESSALLKALEEERDWEKAQRSDTVGAYEDFCRLWPSGRFNEEALRKIDEIKERADFESAKKNKGIEDLRAFLDRWPEGEYKEEAEKILAERGAELAWQTTTKAMVSKSAFADDFSADVLRDFLLKFPSSKYIADVKRQLDAVEKVHEAALDQTHSRSCYERYLANWPSGARRDHALRLLEGGGDDRLWIEVQKHKTVALLERYMAEWPEGRHAKEAATLLPKWKGTERLKEWSLAGFGLTMLGTMAVAVILLVFAAGSFAYNNYGSFGKLLDEARQWLSDLIKPSAEQPPLRPWSADFPGLTKNRTTTEIDNPFKPTGTYLNPGPLTKTPPPLARATVDNPFSTFQRSKFLEPMTLPPASSKTLAPVVPEGGSQPVNTHKLDPKVLEELNKAAPWKPSAGWTFGTKPNSTGLYNFNGSAVNQLAPPAATTPAPSGNQ